ncbi:hypothetical protein DIPPA_06620, partial [Diplonema papillatum]
MNEVFNLESALLSAVDEQSSPDVVADLAARLVGRCLSAAHSKLKANKLKDCYILLLKAESLTSGGAKGAADHFSHRRQRDRLRLRSRCFGMLEEFELSRLYPHPTRKHKHAARPATPSYVSVDGLFADYDDDESPRMSVVQHKTVQRSRVDGLPNEIRALVRGTSTEGLQRPSTANPGRPCPESPGGRIRVSVDPRRVKAAAFAPGPDLAISSDARLARAKSMKDIADKRRARLEATRSEQRLKDLLKLGKPAEATSPSPATSPRKRSHKPFPAVSAWTRPGSSLPHQQQQNHQQDTQNQQDDDDAAAKPGREAGRRGSPLLSPGGDGGGSGGNSGGLQQQPPPQPDAQPPAPLRRTGQPQAASAPVLFPAALRRGSSAGKPGPPHSHHPHHRRSYGAPASDFEFPQPRSSTNSSGGQSQHHLPLHRPAPVDTSELDGWVTRGSDTSPVYGSFATSELADHHTPVPASHLSGLHSPVVIMGAAAVAVHVAWQAAIRSTAALLGDCVPREHDESDASKRAAAVRMREAVLAELREEEAGRFEKRLADAERAEEAARAVLEACEGEGRAGQTAAAAGEAAALALALERAAAARVRLAAQYFARAADQAALLCAQRTARRYLSRKAMWELNHRARHATRSRLAKEHANFPVRLPSKSSPFRLPPDAGPGTPPPPAAACLPDSLPAAAVALVARCETVCCSPLLLPEPAAPAGSRTSDSQSPLNLSCSAPSGRQSADGHSPVRSRASWEELSPRPSPPSSGFASPITAETDEPSHSPVSSRRRSLYPFVSRTLIPQTEACEPPSQLPSGPPSAGSPASQPPDPGDSDGVTVQPHRHPAPHNHNHHHHHHHHIHHQQQGKALGGAWDYRDTKRVADEAAAECSGMYTPEEDFARVAPARGMPGGPPKSVQGSPPGYQLVPAGVLDAALRSFRDDEAAGLRLARAGERERAEAAAALRVQAAYRGHSARCRAAVLRAQRTIRLLAAAVAAARRRAGLLQKHAAGAQAAAGGRMSRAEDTPESVPAGVDVRSPQSQSQVYCGDRTPKPEQCYNALGGSSNPRGWGCGQARGAVPFGGIRSARSHLEETGAEDAGLRSNPGAGNPELYAGPQDQVRCPESADPSHLEKSGAENAELYAIPKDEVPRRESGVPEDHFFEGGSAGGCRKEEGEEDRSCEASAAGGTVAREQELADQTGQTDPSLREERGTEGRRLEEDMGAGTVLRRGSSREEPQRQKDGSPAQGHPTGDEESHRSGASGEVRKEGVSQPFEGRQGPFFPVKARWQQEEARRAADNPGSEGEEEAGGRAEESVPTGRRGLDASASAGVAAAETGSAESGAGGRLHPSGAGSEHEGSQGQGRMPGAATEAASDTGQAGGERATAGQGEDREREGQREPVVESKDPAISSSQRPHAETVRATRRIPRQGGDDREQGHGHMPTATESGGDASQLREEREPRQRDRQGHSPDEPRIGPSARESEDLAARSPEHRAETDSSTRLVPRSPTPEHAAPAETPVSPTAEQRGIKWGGERCRGVGKGRSAAAAGLPQETDGASVERGVSESERVDRGASSIDERDRLGKGRDSSTVIIEGSTCGVESVNRETSSIDGRDRLGKERDSSTVIIERSTCGVESVNREASCIDGRDRLRKGRSSSTVVEGFPEETGSASVTKERSCTGERDGTSSISAGGSVAERLTHDGGQHAPDAGHIEPANRRKTSTREAGEEAAHSAEGLPREHAKPEGRGKNSILEDGAGSSAAEARPVNREEDTPASGSGPTEPAHRGGNDTLEDGRAANAAGGLQPVRVKGTSIREEKEEEEDTSASGENRVLEDGEEAANAPGGQFWDDTDTAAGCGRADPSAPPPDDAMSAISPVKLCDLLRDTGDEAESAVTSPAGFGSPKSPEFRREEGAGACAEGRPPEAIAAGGEGNAAGAKRLPSSPQGRGALGTSESVGTSAKGATREDVAASHPPSPQEGIELEKMDGAGSMSAKGVAPEDVTAVHSSSSQDGNDLKKMEAAGTSAKGVTPDDTAAVDPSSLEDGNELGKMEGVGTSAEGVPPKEINGAIPERHLSSPQDGSGSGRVEVSTPQGGTEALATCSQRRQMEGSARDWPPGDTPAGKAGQGSIGGAGRAGGVGSPTAANPLPVCAEAPIAACSQRRQVEGGVQQDRPPKEVTSDQRFTEADLDTDEGYQAWKTDYGARAVERQLRETREEAAAATVQRAYRAYTLRRCAWQRRRARQTLQWQLRQARYTGDKRGVATLAGALAGLGGEPRDPTPTR